MNYEIWYNAIDGDYYKTSDTLEEANNKDIVMAKAYYNSRTHKGE